MMEHSIIEDIKAQLKNNNPVVRLIVINVVVFATINLIKILAVLTGGLGLFETLYYFLFDNLTLSTNLTGVLYKPWTLITYAFTHTGFFHLLSNMLGLYWFGQLFVNYTSPSKIVPLYLMGGLAGGLFTVILFHTGIPMLGASAGLTAIIVATAVLMPYYKMNLMFFGPVQLRYIASFFVLFSFMNAASYNNIGGNLSHIGGAIMGYIFVLQYKKGNDLSIKVNDFLSWCVMFFRLKPKPKMKTVHKRSKSDIQFNTERAASQEEVDAILEKISKSGYDSLSKVDKETLFKASNKK